MESTESATTLLHKIANWLNQTFKHKSVTVELLKEFCEESNNPILTCYIETFKDVVNLIKEHKRWDLLPFILEQNLEFIQDLENNQKLELINQLKKKSLCNFDTFYTVIRWGDVDLLNILIKEEKLDDDHQLDKLLSNNLNKLMLRGLVIGDNIKRRCEEILYEIRFFDKNPADKNQNIITIENRIDFVIELIEEIDYNHDSVFLLTIRTIAENLFLLMKDKKINKDQSTYLNKMQFLLALYVNKSEKRYKLNLNLNVEKITEYLKLFKTILINIKCNKNNLSLDESKLLETFSKEAQLNRSLFALNRIAHYMKIIDTPEEDKVVLRYAIERCLQVTGEYLKSSDVSPNISKEIEMIFEDSAPNFLDNIRKTRDALSHAEYLRNRLNIANEDYFKLKTELKSIYPKILNIIYMQRFKQFIHDDKVSNNENSGQYTDDYLSLELLQACLVSNQLESNEKLWNHFCKNIKTSNQDNLLDLLIKVIDNIHDINSIEDAYVLNTTETGNKLTELFKILIENNDFNFYNVEKNLSKIYYLTKDENEVEKMIRIICKESKLDKALFDDCLNLQSSIISLIESIEKQSDDIEIKFNEIKKKTKIKLFSENVTEWTEFNKKLKLLNFKNFCLNIKEKLDDIDNVKKYFNAFLGQIYKRINFSKTIISDWLTPKMDDLIQPVSNNLNHLIKLPQKGEMHKAALEMCVMDILELYKDMQTHNNNGPFDEMYVMLIGKELRNHLAHYNISFDRFSNQHSVELTTKIILNHKFETFWKIGLIKNCKNLKQNYIESKEILLKQFQLFKIAESGSLKEFKSYLHGDITNVAKFAVIGDNIEVFKYLFNITKIELNLKQLAIKNNSVKILQYLIELNGSDGNELHLAVLYNQFEIAKTLLNLINSISFHDGLSPLHIACLLGRYDMAKMLIESGADIEIRDSKCNASIHVAAIMGYLDILNLFIWKSPKTLISSSFQQVVDVLVRCKMAIKWMINKTNTTKTQKSIPNKAEIGIFGFKDKTILHFAAGNGYEDIVRTLLAQPKSIDTNSQDMNGQTPLHLAARCGYNNIIKQLLKYNAKLNLKDIDGNTPAHLAAIHNQNNITLKLLIETNCKLKSNNNGDTLLHLLKDCEISILFPIEEYVNCKNKNGQTPLHSAVINNNEEMVKLLTKNKANIYVSDNLNNNPVDYSKKNSSIENYFKSLDIEISNEYTIYEKLLNKHKGYLMKNMTSENIINSLHSNQLQDIEKRMLKINISVLPLTINEMLIRAACNGEIEQMKNLLDNGADLCTIFEDELNLLDVAAYNKTIHLFKKDWIEKLPGDRAMVISASINYLEGIQTLLNNRINVNAYGKNKFNALHCASLNGHLKIVQELIKRKADIHAVINDGWTALHLAAINSHTNIAKLLLENGSNINAVTNQQSTALHLVAAKGNTEIAKLLLEKEININAVTNQQWTALHLVAAEGYTNIAKLLLEKGSDTNIVGNKQWTALHLVASNGHTEITKLLLETGIDINAVTDQQWSALHLAVAEGHVNIAKLLLEKKCNINYVNNQQCNALHISAIKGNTEIAKLLLKNGIDINALTNQQYTALHLVVSNGHTEITKLLLETEIDINAVTNQQCTALHLVASNGNTKIAKLLLEKEININNSNNQNLTPLHIAAVNNHTEIIKLLLEKGSNIDAVTNQQCTALHLVASEGHTNVAKLLLQQGSNINAVTIQQCTALHIVAAEGHADIAKLLLEKEIDVNAVNNQNLTALHIAAAKDHTEIAKLLLKKEIDVNAVTKQQRTALHIAAINGHTEITKLLLEKEIDINAVTNQQWTALHLVATEGHTSIANLLLEKGCNINAINNINYTALHIAAAKGHTSIIKMLLKKESKIDAVTNQQCTALHLVAAEGHTNIAKLLLENGSNINAVSNKLWTPLHQAASNNHLDIAKLLLEKGSNINAVTNDNSTALHIAASKGYTEIAKLLLEKKIDINFINYQQYTALHLVAFYGHTNIAKLLLENGCDINAVTNQQWTALHIATAKGHQNVALLLLEQGSNINSVDIVQRTPLHQAASNNHTNTALLLLENGSEINAVNKDGWTPLHEAASEGHINTVLVLLKKGSDINMVNNKNLNPLNLAISNNHKDIVLLLLEKNINNNSTLHLAVSKGHYNIVLLLLESGSNINSVDNYGMTPLHTAVFQGHSKIVLLLLENGANINAADNYQRKPIHFSFECNKESILNILEDNGADVNAKDINGKTILHKAADFGSNNIVTRLLNLGANINSADINGKTALHLAASNGNLTIVSLLLEMGANINATDDDELKPIHMAAKCNNEDLLNLLIENRANFNDVDKYGNTLLHLASHYNSDNIIQKLVVLGMNINITNLSGSTPLHYAAFNENKAFSLFLGEGIGINHSFIYNYINNINSPFHQILFKSFAADRSRYLHENILKHYIIHNTGDLFDCLIKLIFNFKECNKKHSTNKIKSKSSQIIKLLINCGADVNSLNLNQSSALHYAVMIGHPDSVEMLLLHGADTNLIDVNGYTVANLANVMYQNIQKLVEIKETDDLIQLAENYVIISKMLQ